MFDLNMDAIRESAGVPWLMAIPANPANSRGPVANPAAAQPEISQPPPKLATVAKVAISHAVSQESAELLTARLIAGAMRACNRWGDGPEARNNMREDVLATPPELRAELLQHFNETYPAKANKPV